MNTPDIKFPAQQGLSLRRSASGTTLSVDDLQATLAKAHCRLIQDLEELREREVNLRAYENRLRTMQDEFESGRQAGALKIPSREDSPLSNTPGADEAWRKLHRARELLEIEQKHMVTERHTLRAERDAMQEREAAVAVREDRLKIVLERLQAKEEKSKQGLLGFTRAPFGIGFTKS